MELTDDRFRALARSSPWRWSSLRFVHRRSRDDTLAHEVRAWLRRPDALRVETLDGRVVQAELSSDPRTVGLFTSAGSREVPLRWAGTVTPVVGQDGLVRERPSDWDVGYDDPMYQDYAWVAMLDPAELADGEDGAPGTTLEGVRPVEHHGREAWEALVRPTAGYTPRCSCCALLPSQVSARLVEEEGGPTLFTPGFTFAEAHRVRLDVATGVCVWTEQLGGDRAGWCEDVHIEQVDAPMHGSLFGDRADP